MENSILVYSIEYLVCEKINWEVKKMGIRELFGKLGSKINELILDYVFREFNNDW